MWLGDLWRVSPRWLLETGLRAEGLTGRQWAALSPRLAVKYFATPDLALTAAAKVVGETMTGERQRRLVEEFLTEAPTVATAGGYGG